MRGGVPGSGIAFFMLDCTSWCPNMSQQDVWKGEHSWRRLPASHLNYIQAWCCAVASANYIMQSTIASSGGECENRNWFVRGSHAAIVLGIHGGPPRMQHATGCRSQSMWSGCHDRLLLGENHICINRVRHQLIVDHSCITVGHCITGHVISKLYLHQS